MEKICELKPKNNNWEKCELIDRRIKRSERNILPKLESQKIVDWFFRWLVCHLNETLKSDKSEDKNENEKLKIFMKENMKKWVDSKENFPIFLQELRNYVWDLKNRFTSETKNIVIYAIKEYEAAISKEEILKELENENKKIENNKSEIYLKTQEILKKQKSKK